MKNKSDQENKFGFSGGTLVSQCVLCKHARVSKMFPRASRYCQDFPSGNIPPVIRDNEFDHRKPYPGEEPMKGVKLVHFEPRDDAPPEAVAALYLHFGDDPGAGSPEQFISDLIEKFSRNNPKKG